MAKSYLKIGTNSQDSIYSQDIALEPLTSDGRTVYKNKASDGNFLDEIRMRLGLSTPKPQERYITLGQQLDLEPNLIRNQKYSVITIVPLVLYNQFKYFLNLYFLLVALSQLIKPLQIGHWLTYFGPLIFVLEITIIKEAMDDYSRYLRDKEANSQLYERITDSGVQTCTSAALKCGDLVLIHKNQRVPCDCILLRTADTSGTCFIRTDQLDGETDWKLRIAVPTSQKKSSNEALLDDRATIYAEEPHKDIHSFVGNITWNYPTGNQVDSLNIENTLWMNTVVASDTVLGLVIYTGKDTKAVLNTRFVYDAKFSFASTKVGLVDLEINQLSKILALVTVALSLTMVALDGFHALWYIYFMRFMIIFSSIIPISLRVNLDLGKGFYSFQMARDNSIPNTIVRSSNIPEELGRIDYLLTDKTGTLTKNDMELKKIHMGSISFDAESMDTLVEQLEQAYSPKSYQSGFDFSNFQGISGKIKILVGALALCHNVTPILENDGSISLQAASPDEIAIVKWTIKMGLKLIHRDINTIRLQYHSRIFEYKILQVFPFTSESKRMGIVVQDCESHEISFYQKGADSIMARIVMYNDWLEEECANMAREGLRTLVIGKKTLSLEHYEEFESQQVLLLTFKSAKALIKGRAEATQRVVEAYLERDLELLGLTGVEDKLQENVKLTLEMLRNAGIRIWMLTGDKIETAKCIALSSKLVSRNQPLHIISNVNNVQDALAHLDSVRLQVDCCLIIDGKSLQFYLDNCPKELIVVALTLPAIVCSRCTPTQKADIVRLLNSFTDKRTAAIGDGGNDVSMIQAANVGIGLVGKEGMQASLAADFSITQFSHLARLLLWHGRNSYKRSSKLAHFVIHRGLIISIIQCVFSSLFYFAPLALYQGFILVGYTTIYTMAPVFSIVYDHDIREDTALLYPELYRDLKKGRTLSYKTFFIWFFIAVYQGGAIMILSIWLFENELIRILSISFTALIFNELFMVAMEVKTWHIMMVIAHTVTGLVYITSMWFLPHYFGTWNELTLDIKFIISKSFIWKVGWIVCWSCLPVYIYKRVLWCLNPPSYTKL